MLLVNVYQSNRHLAKMVMSEVKQRSSEGVLPTLLLIMARFLQEAYTRKRFRGCEFEQPSPHPLLLGSA